MSDGDSKKLERGLSTASNMSEECNKLKHFNRVPLWGEPGAAQIDGDLDTKGGLPPGVVPSQFELLRDTVLQAMAKYEPVLTVAAGIGALGVATFGIFMLCLMFPVLLGVDMGSMSVMEPECNVSQYNQSLVLFAGSSQYPPRVADPNLDTITEFGMPYYVATHCTPAQEWFNTCIKFFAFFFAYINLLQLPWTLAIFHNTHFFRPGTPDTGVDFYGRPSESLWFHLPRKTRSLVASLLLFSLLAQTCAVIFHLLWNSYLAGQTFPGALLQNIWIPLQVGSQAAAGGVQSSAEAKVRAAFPGRFPPTMGDYLKSAYQRWLKAHDGKKGPLCCGKEAFLDFVKHELQEYQTEMAKFGKVGALTGVQADAIDDEADVRRDVVDPNKIDVEAGGAGAAASSGTQAEVPDVSIVKGK